MLHIFNFILLLIKNVFPWKHLLLIDYKIYFFKEDAMKKYLYSFYIAGLILILSLSFTACSEAANDEISETEDSIIITEENGDGPLEGHSYFRGKKTIPAKTKLWIKALP